MGIAMNSVLSGLRKPTSMKDGRGHINNQFNTCFWMLVKSGKTKRHAQKILEGTQTSEKYGLLFKEFGISYNSLSAIFRKGSCVFRDKVEQSERLDDDGNLIKSCDRVKVEHCDIIGEEFWKEHPHILGLDNKKVCKENQVGVNDRKCMRCTTPHGSAAPRIMASDAEEGGAAVPGGRAGGGEETRDWSEMTPVCLTTVFRKLSLEDLWKGAMRACRSWREAAKDPSLFSSFDLEPSFDAEGSGNPSDVSAWWTPAFRRRIDSMLRSVAEWAGESLREVRVRHCSDASLTFVAERSPNLRILSIKSSQNVTDSSMAKIALFCPKLQELDISYCYDISFTSLELIGQACSHIKILKRNSLNWLDPSQHVGVVPAEYLNACPQDGDEEAAAIAIGKFMPNLKQLEMRFSKLTARGLSSIAEGCRDLESLDLFGCANLTSRAIEQATLNLKNLKSLVKPNFYIPRSVFHTERYGHWRLYDERFQTNVFQI